eukprot:9764160-Ditylum_brightwellii.AAC.1
METLEIAQRGSYKNNRGETIYIRDALERAMSETVHYHHSHHFPLSPAKFGVRQRFLDTEFHVIYCASLEAVALLKGSNRHIGILNSASGKIPGGGFCSGTVSQEDCLCRASLLYPCIAQFKKAEDHFYQINNNDQYKYRNASKCAVFSPRVPVIREDNVQGRLLDNYYECSFVSIPSTDAFNVIKDLSSQSEHQENTHAHTRLKWQKIERDISDRIFRALSIFAEQGCTDLILTAFGCGAHGNDPYMVASIFKQLITHEFKGCFRTVIFPIQRARPANYEAFAFVFEAY